MKKTFLLIACLCFIAAGLSAQSSRAYFLVKAGMNISDHAGDDAADVKIGYRAALGAEIPIKNNFYFQLTAAVSSKGMKISGTDITMDQLYVEVPILFGYKFRINEKISIPLGVGPYFAYGVAGKTKGDGRNFDTFGNTLLLGKEIKRFDAGMAVNVSAQINRFLVGLDVEAGFIKLVDDYSNTNICTTLGIGYLF